MGQPYAYLRKSRLLKDQEVVSPEMQIRAAQEYAATFGDSNLVVLSDMNVSGRKGRKHRPGFAKLLDAIEAGAVSAVYSYSLSRLSRSVTDMLALADLCRVHKVPIRLARDSDPDPTTASGRAMLAFLAVMAQFEADLASERALDTAATRRARGDHMGGKFFANHQAVIDAYLETRTVTAAARLLTERRIPTRNGNRVWYPSAVRAILHRTAPQLLPRVTKPGLKQAAPFTFYRLLRCHCGTTMTGTRSTVKGRTYTAYVCSRGRYSHHEKAYITERVIQEWAELEMSRLTPPSDLIALREDNDAEVKEATERLRLLKVGFLSGLVPEAEMLAEKAEIDDRLMRLDLAGRVVRVPAFSWDHEPRDLNIALRALWDHVELDRNLRPVRAEWLVPASWLAPPTPR